VDALASVNGVLWITDFISLLSTGGEGAEDSIAAYLYSFVKRGRLRIISELLPQELEVARAKLPAFVQQFKIMNVSELDKQETRLVLKNYVAYIEANFDVQVKNESLDTALQLSSRYLKYEKSPGNILKFFSSCLKNLPHDGEKRIDKPYILSQFIEYTGLPRPLLDDTIPVTEHELMSYFGERIIGQDAILRQLCRTVQLFKAGLNDPQKPIATLLFAGPTGVGKTAATKALAEFFFSAGQKKNPLFSIDMSEFQHPGQIVRLIGDHSQPGKLVSHVRSQPFSVVLLDEIEKAHSSIYDTLLTVLDEGILTDRSGRVTDFRSCIIIMTTNLGVSASNTLGFIPAIKQHFRPEFFNRIDYVLGFNSLDKKAILAITERELKLLHKRDRINYL